ncbi:hypothetical protein EU537_10380 [Candidatus Thorarchaeota archaeon]|nr:MAG: hypothetical protein EU537_10380 [Candidatus Thorarchaeota archaeon]
MRNFLGGLVGSILAMTLAYIIIGNQSIVYPENVQMIEFLLTGSLILSDSLESIFSLNFMGKLLLIWGVVGAIIAPFAVSEWNIFRTTFWLGGIIATFALSSTLLVNPDFWFQNDRNLLLAFLYAKTIMASLISVPFSLLAFKAKKRWLRKKPEPIPERIETVCECGAVYKSNPLVCVECGRQLRDIVDEPQ